MPSNWNAELLAEWPKYGLKVTVCRAAGRLGEFFSGTIVGSSIAMRSVIFVGRGGIDGCHAWNLGVSQHQKDRSLARG